MGQICSNHRMQEYPELEGTHTDNGAQSLAPDSTTQNSNSEFESSVQTVLELWQLKAVPTALDSLFHAHHNLGQNLSLTPTWPSPDVAPCSSFGPCCSPWNAELSLQLL